MRSLHLGIRLGLVVVLGVASGGGTKVPPPAGSTGRVVVVQMITDATGYRFSPATVSVKQGDRVRWTMVSGAPHNVAFWPDSVPAGAAKRLGANMPKSIAPLTGPFLMSTNETYEVSFEGVPKGTYRYFCTPHLALGMKAVVRVE
jgi:plastocyanin